MSLSADTRADVRAILEAQVLRALHRRVVEEPWDESQERISKPFHHALVPPEVWKGSKFERSFVTGMGSLWESVAVCIGQHLHGWAQRSFLYQGELHADQLATISDILAKLERRSSGVQPAWSAEIQRVRAATTGAKVAVGVTVDVALGPEGTREFYEIKAPLPNSDQTKVSKEKMLKLATMEGRDCAFYALPFNPFGVRSAYRHPHAERWFEMRSDPVVLIGDEFWNRIGGEGTFQQLVAVAEEVGEELRPRILNEYLLA